MCTCCVSVSCVFLCVSVSLCVHTVCLCHMCVCESVCWVSMSYVCICVSVCGCVSVSSVPVEA